MKEKVELYLYIIELVKQVMVVCDVELKIKLICGGMDGVWLLFMGLFCLNIFIGGYNFYGIYEFIIIEGMEVVV